MRFFLLGMCLLTPLWLRADTPCSCDPAKAETMKERQCSLCTEAEKQPPGAEFFFLKDINPRKPNRLLILPRAHTDGLHSFASLPADLRTRYLTAAMEKGKSLWGDDWAIAYNGDRVRTQCHTHMHIGKLLPGVEAGDFAVINSLDEVRVPDGSGFWIHPVDGKFHVHTGEQIAETVLLR
jgi:hypothetical protein